MSTLPLQQPSLHFARRAVLKPPVTSAFARTLRICAEREEIDLSQIPLGEPAAQLARGSASVGAPLPQEQESGTRQETQAPDRAQPVKTASLIPDEPTPNHKALDQLAAEPVAETSLKVQFAGPVEKSEFAAEPDGPDQMVPRAQPSVQSPNGLLSRGWAWLKKNNRLSATRQLRVTDTVSLGEKRFVSVVEVEGERFLIGGSSSGVTLLTQLGAKSAKSEALCGLELAREQQR